jgi:hypothetical protein
MVKAQDCESWDCGFESRLSPHLSVQESYGAESLYLFEAPAFYRRGILVVQQSPKLPYGSSILSVCAILAETYRLSDRGVTRGHYGVHPACSQPGGMLTAICRPVIKLNLRPSERKQDGLLPRGL